MALAFGYAALRLDDGVGASLLFGIVNFVTGVLGNFKPKTGKLGRFRCGWGSRVSELCQLTICNNNKNRMNLVFMA